MGTSSFVHELRQCRMIFLAMRCCVLAAKSAQGSNTRHNMHCLQRSACLNLYMLWSRHTCICNSAHRKGSSPEPAGDWASPAQDFALKRRNVGRRFYCARAPQVVIDMLKHPFPIGLQLSLFRSPVSTTQRAFVSHIALHMIHRLPGAKLGKIT